VNSTTPYLTPVLSQLLLWALLGVGVIATARRIGRDGDR